MKISPYKKQNGDLMIYINDDSSKNSYQKAKSIGISDTLFTSKLTEGQKKLLDRFFALFDAEVNNELIEFTGSFDVHTEPKEELACGLTLFITDTATVGGQSVDADGAYLLHKGYLLPLGVEYD